MGDAGEGRIRLSFPFKALRRYVHNMGLTTIAAYEFRPDGKGCPLLKTGDPGFMPFMPTEQFGFGDIIVTNVTLSLRFNLQTGPQHTCANFVWFARLEALSPSLNQVFAGCFSIDL